MNMNNTSNSRNQSHKATLFLNESTNAARRKPNPLYEENFPHETNYIRSPLSQLKIAGACYILSIACGMSMSHTSFLMKELRSNNTSIPTDADTAMWIAHAQLIAVPLGCLLGGVSMDKWGRMKVIMLSSGLFVLGWWLITGAQNHAMIFIGRIINGICNGSIMTLIMVILVEFSDHKTRGPLMTASHLFLILGCVAMYGLGVIADWRVTSGVAGLFPLAAIFTFYFLPESAIWLVRKYRMIEARRTLLWIHGPNREHQAEAEHERMMHRCRADEIEKFRKLAGHSTSISSAAAKYWKTLTTAHILKPFLITLVFNIIQILFGSHLFVQYAVHIINQRGEEKQLESHNIKILTEVLRIPGLLANLVLLNYICRRTLSISSSIASAVFALLLGIIMYFSNSVSSQTERWLMVILVVLYITSDSWGFYILPIISCAELLPGRARGILCGFIYATNGLLMLVALTFHEQIFCITIRYNLFWVFAIFSVACTVFVYLFLPETKGKSLETLEDYFRTAHVLWILRKKVKQSRRRGMDIKLQEMT